MLTLAGIHAGLGLGLLGVHSSAHYDLVPALGVWGSLAPPDERPVGIGGTVELQGALWRADTELYAYRNGFVRGGATVDLVAGTHGTVFRFGLGPALAWRTVRLDGGDLDVGGRFLEPGGRARLGLDAPLGRHLSFRWHLGLTTRTSGLDYDTGLGLGWRP